MPTFVQEGQSIFILFSRFISLSRSVEAFSSVTQLRVFFSLFLLQQESLFLHLSPPPPRHHSHPSFGPHLPPPTKNRSICRWSPRICGGWGCRGGPLFGSSLYVHSHVEQSERGCCFLGEPSPRTYVVGRRRGSLAPLAVVASFSQAAHEKRHAWIE